MKTISALFIFFFTVLTTFAQKGFETRYYDSSGSPVKSVNAFYFLTLKNEENKITATKYRSADSQIVSVINYKDTSLRTVVGKLKTFYENGHAREDAVVSEKFGYVSSRVNYEDGSLWATYLLDTITGKESTKGYDRKNGEIKNFIFEREASFRGGMKEFKYFLEKNLRTETPLKNKAPNGVYTAIIRFIVDKDGELIDITPETHVGYGVEEEAMRVLRNSPKWEPAIQLNEIKRAYRRQPISFVVQ